MASPQAHFRWDFSVLKSRSVYEISLFFFAVLKPYFWSIHMANNLILVISFGFKLNSNLNFDHPSLVGQLQARWVCCSPWNVQFLLLSLSHHALSLLFPPFLPSAYGMLPSLSNLPSPITGGRGGRGLRIHVRCSSSSMGTPQLFASFSSSGDSCVMSDNQEAMNDRAPLIAPPVHATKVSKTLLPLLCVLLNAPPHSSLLTIYDTSVYTTPYAYFIETLQSMQVAREPWSEAIRCTF